MKFKQIIAVCLFGLLCISFTGPTATTTDESKIDTSVVENTTLLGKPLAGSDYLMVSETDSLKLYCRPDVAEFYVENKANGFRWYSNPTNRETESVATGIFKMEMSALLQIQYCEKSSGMESKLNSYTGSTRDGNFQINQIKSGFRIEFDFTEYKFKIPMEVTLGKNGIQVSLKCEEMKIENPNIYILSIAILPYFGAGLSEELGYLFVPDGSGGIINFNNGKYSSSSYSRPIFGEEATDESVASPLDIKNQSIKMPVFGVVRGNNSCLGIITQGAEEAYIIANTNGQVSSCANVYPLFTCYSRLNYKLGYSSTVIYEKIDKALENINIEYRFLQNENANYSGLGREYNSFLKQNNFLSEKSANNQSACYVTIYGGVMKTKSIFGVLTNQVVPLTTTAQVKDIVNQMKQLDIGNIVINYVNWNQDEIKAKLPSSVAIAKVLDDKNYTFDNLQDDKTFAFYPTLSNMLSYTKDNSIFGGYYNAVCDISGVPIRKNRYSISVGTALDDTFYYLTTEKIASEGKKLTKQLAKENFVLFGMSDLSNVLYRDYRKSSVKRTASRKIIEQNLKDIKFKVPTLLLDNPNVYAIPYATDLINVPTSSSNQNLIDYSVPFYQISIGNNIRYALEPINNDRLGEDDDGFLKAVETGSMIHYEWIYEDSNVLKGSNLSEVCSGNYKQWLPIAAKQYKEIADISIKTKGSSIFSHEIITDKVFKITYENGTMIYVNYGDEAYITKTLENVKAKSYTVVSEG